MKLYTHSTTPRPTMSKLLKILFLISAFLIYGMFALGAFACFFYGNSIAGGIMVIAIPIVMTAILFIILSDINKAYIEFSDDDIRVVDYYFGIEKSKHYSKKEVCGYEIALGYSMKVRGYRISAGATQYIIFKDKNKKYLFKIFYHEQTKKALESIFTLSSNTLNQ